MRDDIIVNGISEEMVAAFLEGKATREETLMILNELPNSVELQEIISIAIDVDNDLALGINAEELVLKVANEETLFNTAYAATMRGNLCCWLCEKQILTKHGIDFDEDAILETAKKNLWHCEDGTTLNNIGKCIESLGIKIEQRFNCNMQELAEALNAGKDIIVAVDGGELLDDRWSEILEDIFEGEKPDHSVVVLSCDIENDKVTVYDPNSENETDTYPVEQFLDAWNDSKNYMVSVSVQREER